MIARRLANRLLVVCVAAWVLFFLVVNVGWVHVNLSTPDCPKVRGACHERGARAACSVRARDRRTR